MQKYIIAAPHDKINPYFRFFSKKISHRPRRSGKNRTEVRNFESEDGSGHGGPCPLAAQREAADEALRCARAGENRGRREDHERGNSGRGGRTGARKTAWDICDAGMYARARTRCLCRAVCAAVPHIRALLPVGAHVLVAGLGNEAVTPDAVGPEALRNLIVTRHLKRTMPEVFAPFSTVSAIAPASSARRGWRARSCWRRRCGRSSRTR